MMMIHTFIVMLQPRQVGLEQYENVIKKERRWWWWWWWD